MVTNHVLGTADHNGSMTDKAPLRKVIFLCAAIAGLAGLGACNDQNLSKTFAELKNVPVDASGHSASAADGQVSQKDVELAVNTAKDLTVNKGGLLDKNSDASSSGLPIAVVDPSQMPRPDDGAPLDERVADAAPRNEVLPAPPVTETPVTATPVAASAKPLAPMAGRFIQVGSFASADAAHDAWAGLIERYPGVDRYSAAYQTVTLASGKAMVRLKVGPVADDRQAKNLCGQLDIHDTWCSRAG